MAERKSAFKRAPERPELDALYEASKQYEISDSELTAQQASFVYGNAPVGSGITRKSAEASVVRMRLKPPAA